MHAAPHKPPGPAGVFLQVGEARPPFRVVLWAPGSDPLFQVTCTQEGDFLKLPYVEGSLCGIRGFLWKKAPHTGLLENWNQEPQRAFSSLPLRCLLPTAPPYPQPDSPEGELEGRAQGGPLAQAPEPLACPGNPPSRPGNLLWAVSMELPPLPGSG